MGENKDINIPFPTRYKILDSSLFKFCEDIKKKYGVKVEEIKETESGYVFLGEFGLTIGELMFDYAKGEYRNFDFNQGTIELIRQKKEELQNNQQQNNKKNKFALQVGKRIGITLTALAVGALASYGVIKTVDALIPDKTVTSDENDFVVPLQSIDSASDLLIIEWANSAMSRVTALANSSDYDIFKERADIIYKSYFAPLMSNYYNYLYELDSNIPLEYKQDIMDSYHNNFRSLAVEFNNILETYAYSDCVFSATPYSNALIVDDEGNVLTCNEKNETYAVDGTYISFDDSYNVYFDLIDLGDEDFGTEEFSNIIEYEGRSYVMPQEKQVTHSKK